MESLKKDQFSWLINAMKDSINSNKQMIIIINGFSEGIVSEAYLSIMSEYDSTLEVDDYIAFNELEVTQIFRRNSPICVFCNFFNINTSINLQDVFKLNDFSSKFILFPILILITNIFIILMQT